MDIFNSLPARSEDAIRVIASILDAAAFLKCTKYDEVSVELINSAHEYTCALSALLSQNEQISTTHQPEPSSQPFGPYDGGNLVIGERIHLARENLSIHEADLARLLNTYSDHISDWECGISEPPASMVIPLANALKCDLMWLLTGESVAIARES